MYLRSRCVTSQIKVKCTKVQTGMSLSNYNLIYKHIFRLNQAFAEHNHRKLDIKK